MVDENTSSEALKKILAAYDKVTKEKGGLSEAEVKSYLKEIEGLKALAAIKPPLGTLGAIKPPLEDLQKVFEEQAAGISELYAIKISDFYLVPTILDPNNEQNLLSAYLASPEFQEDLDEGIRKIHEDYGERMLEMVQMLCPKDTLTLTNSLYLIVDDDGVSIFSDCDYFPYVEAKYHMVEIAYMLFEPAMLAEIQLFITSKLTVGT
jgi:hypothetical protein